MKNGSGNSSAKRCELCGREVNRLEIHHLIPRTRHRNKRNKREFGREEVKSRLAHFCRACHKQVHAVLSEKELEREYNTVDALRAHDEIAAFIDWVRKRPGDQHVTVRRTQARRDAGKSKAKRGRA